MGAKVVVAMAVAASGERTTDIRMSEVRGTGTRFDALVEVLGPLAVIAEPQHSWLLLCSGDNSRLRTVTNALYDIALVLYPRSNADRLYTLCQIVACDRSRGENAAKWGCDRVSRQMGISEQSYAESWHHKRKRLEDELSAWDEAWGAAAEILRGQGVIG